MPPTHGRDRIRHPLRLAILAATLLGSSLVVACATGAPWSPADSVAVTDALARFRAGWLANDSAAVMAHIADDMVLYVPGPVGTLRGRHAVRDYWFPPSGDTTYPIVRYESHDERVTGTGDIAIVEGRSVLGWSLVVRGTTVSTTVNTSEFMTVLRRDGDQWRIARNMFVARP
jgi:ketosteroid isomerase-like protein